MTTLCQQWESTWTAVTPVATYVRVCKMPITNLQNSITKINTVIPIHEMQTIVTDVCGVCPSVCLSQIHRMTPYSEADLKLGFTVRGHSVQPLPNHFGHLFTLTAISWVLSSRWEKLLPPRWQKLLPSRWKNYFHHADKLHTSQQRQPHTKHTNSTCTHARSYYGRSRPGLRPGPGISCHCKK